MRLHLSILISLIAFADIYSQDCKTVLISPVNHIKNSSDTCFIYWQEGIKIKVHIPATAKEIVFMNIYPSGVIADCSFENPENINSLKILENESGEYDNIEGLIRKFVNVSIIEGKFLQISPEYFLQLKKAFPKVKFNISNERPDISKNYKGIAMCEAQNNILPADTFYLIGYGWDSRESWSAIYELNFYTVEKLILSPDWDYHYKFNFQDFLVLNTLVLINYDVFKDIQNHCEKAAKNPKLKTIILRNCEILQKDKVKLEKKLPKIKFLFEGCKIENEE
jgi:hypothetical protein